MVTKKKGLEDTSGAYQYSFKKTTENSIGDNYIISIQLHYIVIKTVWPKHDNDNYSFLFQIIIVLWKLIRWKLCIAIEVKVLYEQWEWKEDGQKVMYETDWVLTECKNMKKIPENSYHFVISSNFHHKSTHISVNITVPRQ